MQSRFMFVLDDESVAVSGEPIRRTLGEFLEGADSFSGAPLLALDFDSRGKSVIRAVDASLILLPAAAGRQFWTPSRLPESHPIVALVSGHPEWCTDRRGRDWVIASLVEAWHAPNEGSDVERLLDGCPGRTVDFAAVRDAARSIADMDGRNVPAPPFAEALSREPVAKDDFAYVDAAKKRFYRPNTRSEAVQLRAQHPGDTCVFSLDGIPEARIVLNRDDRWEIGSALSPTSAIDAVRLTFPLLAKADLLIGDRSRLNALSLSDCLESLAPALMALDASVRAISTDGERDIPLSRFFEGNGRTHLRPNELLGSLILPVFKPVEGKARGAVSRIADCVGADAVRAGFLIEYDRENRITRAILAYSGIADRPIRARETEQALTGLEWSEESLLGVLGRLGVEIDRQMTTDGRSERDLEYRRQLVSTLLQKFFYDSAMQRFS
jgi:xanthine dehydrogenase small subunit